MDGIIQYEGSPEKRAESSEDRQTRDSRILGRPDVNSGTNPPPTQNQPAASGEAPIIRPQMTRKEMEDRIAKAANVPGVQ